MLKPGFYAVKKGRKPGVYTSWDECEIQIKGFAGAIYKKFSNAGEAEAYAGVIQPAGLPPPSPSKLHTATKNTAIRMAGDADSVTIMATKSAENMQAQSSALTDEDVVYCDGACKGNGQVGSISGIGVWWGRNDRRNISERCPGDQTNNRAELFAIVRTLETTPMSERPIIIKTDSKYSIDCLQSWLPKWLRNGFKTASGGAVKNVALIQYISALLDQRARASQKVRLQHVRGHAGEEGNEGADYLANVGATLPPVPERDWIALTKDLERAGAKCIAAKGLDTVLAKNVVKSSPESAINFEMYADALLSDEELRQMAANGELD